MKKSDSINVSEAQVPTNNKISYNTNTTGTISQKERTFNNRKARKLVKKGERPTSSNMDQKLNYADSEDWYF